MSELKPCPFCGGPGEMVGDLDLARCRPCYATANAQAWNRRAATPEAERLAEIVHLATPIADRMRSMLADNECDCLMEGGVHICGAPEARRELAAFDRALAAEPGRDEGGETGT